jgi:hypothetical protein
MWDGGDLARPDLPMPACRVKLVCGPPAAGKTTYVLHNFTPGDIIIDLDVIAQSRLRRARCRRCWPGAPGAMCAWRPANEPRNRWRGWC